MMTLCATALLVTCLSMDTAAGIWTSAEELADKPTSGPGWTAVVEAANAATGPPDLGDINSNADVQTLAAAIVFARTGELMYRTKVESQLQALVADGKPGGETLGWARGLGAYVMAADLIGHDNVAFDLWVQQVAEEWEADDGRTLIGMFHERPNNWGTHAFASLCAAYRYLGRTEDLVAVRDHWLRLVDGPVPDDVGWGDDRSWHADADDPRLINPAGSMIEGLLVDGVLPDDQRRGGGFALPPGPTGYVWEAQQGLVTAARILERAGYPIWTAGDYALLRVLMCYHVRFQIMFGASWAAQGDDRWLLAFYDAAYGTRFSRDTWVWGAGKNAGWAYVVLDEKGQIPAGGVADIDGDDVVGISDLLVVIDGWGSGPGDPADLNGDGDVGVADLLILIDWFMVDL